MRQSLGDKRVPSPARIASILRSTGPSWAELGPLDLAQQLAEQQRRLVSPPKPYGQLVAPACAPLQPYELVAPTSAIGGSDAQVSQLAERVSVRLASLEQRFDEELRRQAERLEAKLDSRVTGVEARLDSFEGRIAEALAGPKVPSAHGLDPRGDLASAAEVRLHVEQELTQLQSNWQLDLTDVQEEQRQQLEQLEELAGQVHHCAARLEQSETALSGALQRTEEQVKGLLSARGGPAPNWFGQLEAAVNAVECRLNDQQVAAEVQMGRLHVELDGLRRKWDGARGQREEVSRDVAARLEELERQQERRFRGHAFEPPAAAAPKELRDLARRLEDVETKTASVKVRLDAQEDRISSVCDRADAASQQAVEAARQAASQLRQDVLSEAECQLQVLRGRVESLSELCEDQLLRAPHGGKGAPAASGPSMPPRMPH